MKITCDSGISPQDQNKVIPIQVTDNLGNNYKEGINITIEEIIENTLKGTIYKTSSPSLEDYYNKFEKLIKDDDIIHLSMSSKLSAGSFNASNLVKDDINENNKHQVYVIDTLTGATGGTIIDYYATLLVNQGLDVKEVVKRLEEMKTRIVSNFIVPDPTGFIRSGRDSSDIGNKEKMKLVASKFATLSGLKTKVSFNEQGELKATGFIKSNQKKCFNKLVLETINENTIKNYDSQLVVIGNLYREKVNMEEIKDYINSFNYFENIIEKQPQAIASYGCPDLCGISLVKKK